MSFVKEMGNIDPESPERLRQCLRALAQHEGRHVLRLEIELGASTRTDSGPAMTMTFTHSLGPEHEALIGPVLANAFATTMQALSAKIRAEDAEEDADDEAAQRQGPASDGK